MQRALDFLLAKVSTQAIPDVEPDVRAALRLGAYQLLIGIPAHAAVGETVEAVERAPARLRQRRAARARAHRAAVVVARRRRDRGPRRAHLAPRLDRAHARRRVRPGRRARDARARRRTAAGDAARQPDARDGRRCRTRAARLRHRRAARRARARRARRRRRRRPRVVRRDRATAASRRRIRRARRWSPRSIRNRASGSSTSPPRPAARRPRAPSAWPTPGSSSRPISTRVGCGRSPAARSRLGLTSIVPVVADGTDAVGTAGARSTGCCSTRRAAGSACCGAAPTRAGASARATCATCRSCSARCSSRAADAVRPGGRLVYAVCTISPKETRQIDEFATSALPEFDRGGAAAGTLAPARSRCVAAAVGRPHRRHVRPRARTGPVAGPSRSSDRPEHRARRMFRARHSRPVLRWSSARRLSPSGVLRRG